MKQFKMLINAADHRGCIRPEIYGHFAEHLGRCIYDGIFVGADSDIPNIHGIRKDIVEAFRRIHMPVLRWPGGCFADEYHWADGIGEPAARKKMINTTWGGVVDDNSFGTHEFMELCELIGCEPYITGNLGSGTVQEMSGWIEYITFDGISPLTEQRRRNGRDAAWKLKYFGFGNESWVYGGNMRPEYYADTYRRYQTFCKDFSGNQLFRIAVGPCGGDYQWTEHMMQLLKNGKNWLTDALALHYYAVPDWDAKGSATDFDADAYYRILHAVNQMGTLLRQHICIMDRYDPECKVGLAVDEWGTWYDTEPETNPAFLYQQNTMRDALAAALTLHHFQHYSRRVVMANIAQAVNVLQALILTKGEQMILTPTYHVFDLLQAHQGGEAVYCFSENENMREGMDTPMLSSSASVKEGVMTLTLANCSLEDTAEIHCDICNFACRSVSARILNAEVHACNDFDAPERVRITPHHAEFADGVLHVTLPPCSVAEITLRSEPVSAGLL